ncbi:DedA family protein [Pleomorphomonas sp. JP5]|uniref:DedA family protein n=1 Tax=Pleomorphomonas sp. JP5 TaxID=2942998 RepID=UPI0020446C3A|nr:DedA family protein [Pleomorphomonas sp. JP5]MCM5557874.1 DedA family protein [Pleomorphomonas sp. JP5]
MTDTLLALVPTYGSWLVLIALLLSCLALPVPSSILVMTAGGFAASGDLVLWQVQAMALAGFVIGDQVAYALARTGGKSLIIGFRRRPGVDRLFGRAQMLLDRHGVLAVFLSRTIFSPLGPYLGYLSGSLGLPWLSFTLAAVAGALCWCAGYSLLGYAFATQIADIALMIGNAMGFLLGGLLVAATAWYLWRSWRAEKANDSDQPPAA